MFSGHGGALPLTHDPMFSGHSGPDSTPVMLPRSASHEAATACCLPNSSMPMQGCRDPSLPNSRQCAFVGVSQRLELLAHALDNPSPKFRSCQVKPLTCTSCYALPSPHLRAGCQCAAEFAYACCQSPRC
jgi:hypothetical protein